MPSISHSAALVSGAASWAARVVGSGFMGVHRRDGACGCRAQTPQFFIELRELAWDATVNRLPAIVVSVR
jgi:hypothetical protein